MSAIFRREWSAMMWSKLSPHEQAEKFRSCALAQVKSRHRRLRAEKMYYGANDEPLRHHIEAINRFSDLTLLHGRDDDAACEAAVHLLLAVDGECRGGIPDEFLYVRAGGPRVRATLLKKGFTHGNSVGALFVNATSKVVLREYFREAGHDLLMDANELDTIEALQRSGRTVRLYRGTGRLIEPYNTRYRGMSWTRDRATAERFANGNAWGGRWAGIMTCEYPVRHILALWETSGREPEVVIDPTKAKNISVEDHTYVEPLARAA
ncbi:hypothetical protein [Camelimonas lactis]|uniref:Uncharacterized protein n=1 Tax=Camelimonas lactis TaxID=659006 RepID=A0A4R2GGN7_9HYPH|nr:hypothetical protein [Camelimonas lactis]TCO07146.1 hypothetical protein EV666_1392 [Camelimonas lactis]